MCGRFAFLVSIEQLMHRFGLAGLVDVHHRYNIAPQQQVALVRADQATQSNELALAQWGMVPPWAKDPTIGRRMINARSETAAEKPAYKNAMRRRRCIIPASGFYEWQKTPHGKQPWYFQPADDPLFAFAGLWEHWQDADGTELQTCTILTTAANDLCKTVHDRMPVIIPPDDTERWLGPGNENPATLADLLRPYDSQKMQSHPVSPRINKPANDDPSLIQPIEQPGTLF